MFKFVRLLQDFRLSIYVVVVAFQTNLILGIGADIFNGKVDETTFYKVVSFAWSIFALMCLRTVYAMWISLKEATDDIRTLTTKTGKQA